MEFSYIAQAYQTLMDDQAKAEYDDKLIHDTDFYSIKLGAVSVRIKYIFMFSLGCFIVALAISESREEEEDCPGSYKIKKIGISEAEVKEEVPEIQNYSWSRIKKIGTNKELLQAKNTSKAIFAKNTNIKDKK